MQFKIQRSLLNTYLSETLDDKMLRNCIPWRLIQIFLIFSKVTAERENVFSTNDIFERYMALVAFFSPPLTITFPETYFLALYHFSLGDMNISELKKHTRSR